MEQKALEPKKSITHTLGISALAVMLIFMASTLFFWQNIAVQARAYAHNALTEQIKEYLGEEVSFKTISFIPAGEVTLTDIVVVSGGDSLAKIPSLVVHYNWHWNNFQWDKFNFQDLAYIERIHLDKSEFFFGARSGQLDLMPILKGKPSGTQPTFEGVLEFDTAKINFNTAWDTGVVIDEITGAIDFKNQSEIAVNLAGYFDQSELSVTGHYSPKNGELLLKNSLPLNLAAHNFREIFLDSLDVNLQEIVLENLAFYGQRVSGDAWRIKADGQFSRLYMDGPADIKNGRGSFVIDNEKISFANMSLLFFGQKATGSGDIFLNGGSLKDTAIKFSLSLPEVNPLIISSDLADENPINIDASIAGSFKNPQASGKFSITRLDLDTIPVSNITGSFDYVGGAVSAFLKNVRGESLGGVVTADGELFFLDQAVELDISGRGLDSFLILGKEIKGALDFNAHMSARPKNATARGNFIVRNGQAYGTEFQVFNGFFVKQDGKSDLSNVAVRTASGRVYPAKVNKEAFGG